MMIYKYNVIKSKKWSLEIEAGNEIEAKKILNETIYDSDFLGSTAVEGIKIKRLNK